MPDDESTTTSISDRPRGSGVVRSIVPRLLGLILLVILLIRIDISALADVLAGADIGLVVLAVFLLIALIGVKTVRWLMILDTLRISMPIRSAFLAYFASIFIGFLTPGRLGEFGRAFYVRDEPDDQPGLAFSSVLADRLFDLYALSIVGGTALFSLASSNAWIMIIALSLVCVVPLLVFFNDALFGRLRDLANKAGRIGQALFRSDGWLEGIRRGLKQLNNRVFSMSVFLTLLAYFVFFGQCYLLSLALDIQVGYPAIMFAVALGSLITLLPFSISGLGTREATITAYLSTVGVSAETALSFSLLVFATFYLAGGLLGAIAWWIHPIQLDFKRLGVK